MQDDHDRIQNLKSYYDKLARTLRNEADFKLFGKAIFDKRRIDDAMCCVEANFPREFNEYKKNAKTFGEFVETFKLYSLLVSNIKIKPPIGTSSYLVKVNEALKLIDKLKFVASSDLKYIKENFPNI